MIVNMFITTLKVCTISYDTMCYSSSYVK